jgi:hypothetical protein
MLNSFEMVRQAVRPAPPSSYAQRLLEGQRERVRERRFSDLFERCARESRADSDTMSETAVALHEAAHAVVAVILGVRIVEAVLCTDDGRTWGGYVSHVTLSKDEGRALLRGPAFFLQDDVKNTRDALRGVSGGVLEAMTVTAAGPAMNGLLGLNRSLARHDLVELEKWAAVLTGRPSFESMKGYCRETRRLLATVDQQAIHLITLNAAWVSRVAQALLRERRLTADEIRRLQQPSREKETR